MVRKINIKELFSTLQEEMQAALGIIGLRHGPTKGDYTEINWLDMFQKYLPKRYVAEKAFVIDSKGQISEAIDIVIFDNHFSPFLLNKNGVKFVPAESVYAVFEVKQELNRATITYAIKKAKSVARLYRTTTEINNAGQIVKPKKHFEILRGILTSRCGWSRRSFKTQIQKIANKKTRGDLHIGCCLNTGSFNRTPEGLLFNEADQSLVGFFFDLVGALQNVGTVPAMDISTYKKKL